VAWAAAIALFWLIVVLRRAGLRIHDALAHRDDLHERRGSLIMRHGEGDRRRSGRQTSCGLPFRAAEARMIGLRRVSSITARSVRYCLSALTVISGHGRRHVVLTPGQKLLKSTCERWSFGTNPRAPCACAIA